MSVQVRRFSMSLQMIKEVYFRNTATEVLEPDTQLEKKKILSI
jgi:hypothetical protein